MIDRPSRLIATDLDGTLLRRDGTVSPRTRAALDDVARVGWQHVMVSGRPPRRVRLVADQIGAGGLAICCNGALIYDLADGLILHHRPLATDHARVLVHGLRARLPGIAFAVERGLVFGAEPHYVAQRQGRVERVSWQDDALALCAAPLTKLIAYHAGTPIEELRQMALDLAGDAVDATYSGADFLEIAAAGADKAAALAWLCERRGLTADHVVAFGDMVNDLAMLRWAGHSVAVANAHPAVLAVVDEVTADHDADGVAAVIERLLASK
ncbi:MAG: Cof-type HAD-IIB family hydrolase [Chloroflexi bacterium]|nr:Cof-type HAD-IIB family hydrolase [Chloroflexota bacterium]